MGFWDKLGKMLDGDKYSSYDRLRNTIPPPPPMKHKETPKDISEPVLSLVETIRNGEWEHTNQLISIDEFTHIWLGTTLYTADRSKYSITESYHCTSKWMNSSEQDLVGQELMRQKEYQWKVRQNIKNNHEREKFMVFVNADYNKEKQ